MDTPIPAEATAITVAAPTPMVPSGPVVQEPNSLLPAILELARDKAVDVTKLDALLKMQAQLEDRQAKQEAIQAFARLSAAMPRVKKNGTISLGEDKTTGKARGSIPFARWEDIDKVIRPLLAAEGFTLSFDSAAKEGGGLVVTGELMHRSGHVRTAMIPLALDTGPGRNNLQAMGSTLSYGKRYCAEMLLNIVREGDDDDGVKGGTAYITPDQCEELLGLIRETDADEAKFLSAAGAAELGLIPAGAFTMAKNLLLSRKKRAS